MKHRTIRSRRGFTLIEMLTATTILLIIMVLAVSLISSATSLSSTASRRIGVREEARAIFDRMTLDFESVVQFDQYQINSSADGFSLITRHDGDSDKRFQRVDYASEKINDEYRIIRSVQKIDWSDKQELNAISAGTEEVLSQAVAEMKVMALMSDGSVSAELTQPSVRVDPRPVGLVVGLALIDANFRASRKVGRPAITVDSTGHQYTIRPEDEAAGWRLYQTTFRFP